MSNITNLKCLNLNELTSLIGISRSSIYDRMNPRSKRYDPSFPKPLKLGSAVRWRLKDISEWLEDRASITS